MREVKGFLQLEITKSIHTHDAIEQIHRQFSNLLRRQAEETRRLAQSLKSLPKEQWQLKAPASPALETLERSLTGEGGTETHSPYCVLSCRLCGRLRVVNEAPAAIEDAPGSRYAENPTEQPDGDKAQLAPQHAIPSPEIPVLGSSQVAYEIELYNRKILEEESKNRDFYQRLKTEIGSSREIYEKRNAHTVAQL